MTANIIIWLGVTLVFGLFVMSHVVVHWLELYRKLSKELSRSWFNNPEDRLPKPLKRYQLPSKNPTIQRSKHLCVYG